MLTHTHYISILATLVLVSLAGVLSARFVRTDSDFSVGGRRMGASLVGGALAGSFIGGTSTVGTAQMAYQYGISAVWFTLGAGLACLLLAFTLVRPLRAREVETVPQLLAGTYGDRVRPWIAAYTSAGMFIQIVAQCLAAIPLLTRIFPLSPQIAALIFTLALFSYVFLGGFWGTGLVGMFKTALIFATIFTAGIISYRLTGGLAGAAQALPASPWFSLFPRGAARDAASVFSVIIGFLSTQTYLTPVFAGRSTDAARKGVFLAAFLIPVVGLSCVAVGLFMQVNYPGISPASALPAFLTGYLPPWLGGAALATLLVSVVLTGAALTLSVATVLAQDIYVPRTSSINPGKMLLALRSLVLAVGLACLLFTCLNLNTMILEWAFLSMTLRGVTVFFPLLFAVVFAAKSPSASRGVSSGSFHFTIASYSGARAIIFAPLATIAWVFLFPRVLDPLYAGILLSFVLLLFSLEKTDVSLQAKDFTTGGS